MRIIQDMEHLPIGSRTHLLNHPQLLVLVLPDKLDPLVTAQISSRGLAVWWRACRIRVEMAVGGDDG